jgi:hypothetical protein
MFNFLRRLATPELHQQLSIRERARIQVFTKIDGLDAVASPKIPIIEVIL